MTIGNMDTRITTRQGDIIIIRVWTVPKSVHYPDGKKFSFTFIHKGERVLGYGNAEQKGIHKHSLEGESKVDEQSIERILRIFKKEIGELTKKVYGEPCT